MERLVYGNTIEKLDLPVFADGREWPWRRETMRGDDLRLWHLSSMVVLGDLSEEKQSEISRFSQRRYEYAPKEKHTFFQRQT
jgi:hypothetical protein